ncbi:hypothetical protein JTB14_021882 [Gonioctena quinquepunctata]|nr:hypothetical protein JTB14_021882 [Gonioctena quinquepunctata]
MVGTVIGPGTIFLMLIGAFVAAFKMSQKESFILNAVPVLLFVVICACCSSDIQLFFAAIISVIYALVMMTVLIAFMHPQEFYCLKYGVIYYITVPSMYMLLVIYSVFNMNDVSWGTRDVTIVKKPKNDKADEKEEKKKEEAKPPKSIDKVYSFFGNNTDNAGSIEFSFAGLFKILCFTYQNDAKEQEMLKNIQASLAQVQQKLDNIEHNRFQSEFEPRKTEGFVQLAGSKASRKSVRKSVNQKPNEEDEYDEDNDSIITPSDDVPENIWFYEGELEKSSVEYLDRKEEQFWEKFISKYLEPIDDSDKKDEVAKDLKDLRDKTVITFFMINSIFVLVIFLLNLQQDLIHLNWPIDPKINFTYITDQNEIVIYTEYLQLQPIGFVFLIGFALVIFIQFFAMFVHRFGTFCQIMANTTVSFNPFASDSLDNLTEENILEKDSIKIIKKLFKLQGINDDKDGEKENPVGKRNTAHYLAMKKGKKAKAVIEDLEEAFQTRLERIRNNETAATKINLPRHTQAALFNRINDIHRRQTELLNNQGNASSSRGAGRTRD